MLEGLKKLFLGHAEGVPENPAINVLPQHGELKEFTLRDVLSAFTNTNLATDDDNFGKKPLAFNLNAGALSVVTFLSGQPSGREHAKIFVNEVQEEIVRQLPQFDAVDVTGLTALLKQIEAGKQPVQYKKFMIDDWYQTHENLLGSDTITLAFQKLVPEYSRNPHLPNVYMHYPV